MRVFSRAAVAACVVTAILLAGCGEKSKYSKSELAKVHAGMTLSEVEAVLGKGETMQRAFIRENGQRVDVEIRLWKEGKRGISVTFTHDVVSAASMVD